MAESEHPVCEAVIRGSVGAAFGACVGLVFLSVGLVRAALALLRGVHVGLEGLWPEAGIYVLGFASAGAVMGALWPARPGWVRQYLAGIMGGMVVVAVIARLEEGPLAGWSLGTYLGIAVLGAMFGVAFIWGLRSPPAV